MTSVPFNEFLSLKLHPRAGKPRTRGGITMVIDIGYNLAMVESVLEQYGHLIDIVKLTELHLTAPVDVIRRKIALYKAAGVGVQPGGVVMELARLQKQEHKALEQLRELGFDHIEISSSTTTQRDYEIEKQFIALAESLGFKTIGEVGKKFHVGDKSRISDTEMNFDETVHEFRSLLEGGAKYVYWEGHVLRRLMGDTGPEMVDRYATGTAEVKRVVDIVGQTNIIFEVSSMIPYIHRRAQQFWLVRNFGPDVNVGNVRLEEVQFMEHIRLGTWPVFGFGQLGDHPFMQAIEATGGTMPTNEWWNAIPMDKARD